MRWKWLIKYVTGCFRGVAPLLMFDRIQNTTLSGEEVYHHWSLLILLIHTKHKTIIWDIRLTPRLHFLGGALIHWVDRAKNVGPIVGQLPIKIGWWDASLALRDFNWSNKHQTQRQQNLGLTPHPHLLDRELIHSVDKAKSMWIIVGQLPIKNGR